MKLDARFFRMPLKDRGQAWPSDADRPTAKAQAGRITKGCHSALTDPMTISGKNKNDLMDGMYAYLKEQDAHVVGARESSQARRANYLPTVVACSALPNRSLRYDSAGD